MRLGEPWIKGYLPSFNFQKALLDGVERHLTAGTYRTSVLDAIPLAGLSEGTSIFFGPPPLLAPLPDDRDPVELKRLIRKFDPAARDEKNRVLGRHGEEIIFETERNRLILEDRPDLARRVRWVSAEDGDGAGYDIHSFDRRGRDRLLEVKTTAGHELTPFYLSENERAVSDERADDFRLVRVYDAMRAPRAFELHPPLEKWVHLQAINYRASFGVQT